MPRCAGLLLWGLLVGCGLHLPTTQYCIAMEATGLIAPAGFEVTKFAGDELAHDIYTIITDPQGSVIVGGPGYIRRLVDTNGDGVVDQTQTVLNKPLSGPHGLCFTGQGLLVNGDNQLSHWTDRDRDGVYDQTTVWSVFKTTEHGGNNIVRGPDNWYYVALGNDAGIKPDFVNDQRSPLKTATAGAIVRFSPNGSQRQIVADGFRNIYGLAFDSQERLWTYDSDNERDQFLPWYCPTRIFRVVPGRSYGWIHGGWQNGWNQPELWNLAAPRHRELGRGSPTGVWCVNHPNWPSEYKDEILAACWSRGRIYRIPSDPHVIIDRRQPAQESELFLRATPGTALAVVGMTQATNGDLFVAVGGRKTQGSVYRIRYTGQLPGTTKPKTSPAKKRTADGLWTDSFDDTSTLTDLERGWRETAEQLNQALSQYARGPNLSVKPEVIQAYTAVHRPTADLSLEWLEKYPLDLQVATLPDTLRATGVWYERQLNLEAARLFAYTRNDRPEAATRILTRCTKQSPIEDDLHYLIVLTQLQSEFSQQKVIQLASIITGLQHKLIAAEAIPSRNWPLRVGELLNLLHQRVPGLADALAADRQFCLPQQVLLINTSPQVSRATLLRRLLSRIGTDSVDEWTGEMINSLSLLPREEMLGYLRIAAREPALLDAVIAPLAAQPTNEDRALLLSGLDSIQPRVVQAAAEGLRKLPPPTDPKELLRLVNSLQGLCSLGGESASRAAVAQTYSSWTNSTVIPAETNKTRPTVYYASLFEHFRRTHPELAKQLQNSGGDWQTWKQRLSEIPFDRGEVTHGKELFAKLQCAACHTGAGHLGPDLKGITDRMTNEDLLSAIVEPDRDISPTYQVKVVNLADGRSVTGIIVYESPETTLVITGPDATAQLTGVTAAMIQPSRHSLMPSGLLNRATNQDAADLLQYLRTLR